MYVASLIYDPNLVPVLQFMYFKHVVLGHFLEIKFVFLILIFFNNILQKLDWKSAKKFSF